MYWNELPCNELMSRIFSKSPEIGDIVLFDMEIKTDGWSVIVSFDLVDVLPDNPPVKWGKYFNRCRMGIYCVDVSDLAISGMLNDMPAKIYFDLNNERKSVTIKGHDLTIMFTCVYIRVTDPAVYCCEE